MAFSVAGPLLLGHAANLQSGGFSLGGAPKILKGRGITAK